jgi:hypothetical protein
MTMPSMPQPIPNEQDDNSMAAEIVLTAAALSTLGVLLTSDDFPATAAG